MSPVSPFNPCGPVAPDAPVAPRGIVKLNTAAVVVPEFTIEAEESASPVKTDPNVIVEDPPPEDRPDTAVEIALFLFVTSVAIFASVYEFTDTVFDCIDVLSSALAAITFAEASSAAAAIAWVFAVAIAAVVAVACVAIALFLFIISVAIAEDIARAAASIAL